MKGFLRDMGFGRAPHNPTDDVFQLNVMDRAGAISNMMGWTMLRFDQVLDPVMLRETLVSVIKTGDWRKLGGRFRRNSKGHLEIHVPKEFTEQRPALGFSHAVHTCRVQDHELGRQLPTYEPEEICLAPSPVTFHEFAQPEGVPQTLNDYLCSDLPQLWLHIVSFEDATLTCLTWPHATMDGAGLSELLMAWAYTLAGLPKEVPPCLSLKYDLLDDLVSDAPDRIVIKDEKYFNADKVVSFAIMRIMWLVMLVLRAFFAPKKECRNIWVPKRVMDKIRQEALAGLEAANEGGELGFSEGLTSTPSSAASAKKGKEYAHNALFPAGIVPDRASGRPFISESDALIAFFTRVASRALPAKSRRTVNISIILNIRDRLPTLTARLPKPGVFVSNLAMSIQALVPAQAVIPKTRKGPVAEENFSSLGLTAASVRSSLHAGLTEPQLRALAKVQLKAYKARLIGFPILGGIDSFQVLFSSLKVGPLFEMNVFAPAIVKKDEEKPPVDKGKVVEAVADAASQLADKSTGSAGEEAAAAAAAAGSSGEMSEKTEEVTPAPSEEKKTEVSKETRKKLPKGCTPVGILVIPRDSSFMLAKMQLFIFARGANGAWVQGTLQPEHWKVVEEELKEIDRRSLWCSPAWRRASGHLGKPNRNETAASSTTNEPDWVVEQALHRKREELSKRWQEREERLKQIREKEQRDEKRAAKRRRLLEEDRPVRPRGQAPHEDEDEFLLDWEGGSGGAPGLDDASGGFSKETRDLLEKVGLGFSKQDTGADDDIEENVKIFYTSRTHSQLTQFISELRRPNFPSSFPGADEPSLSKTETGTRECVKHVPLSSRQKLCINPAVARLGSVAAINDRCTELQKSKAKSEGKRCPYVPSQDNLSETHQFRDASLATIPDIEDAHKLGKSLQGSVVVVDEAHNIMDAIAGVHSAEIRLEDLRRGREMLSIYAKRFGKKLKAENRIMVGQVARVIQGLSEWLERALEQSVEHGIIDPRVLLKTKGMDQIDMFALISYIQESKLAYKIESYAAHVDELEEASKGQKKTIRTSPVLHNLSSFLLALTNLSTEGRIFFEKVVVDGGSKQYDIKLSYMLLSPTYAFSSIATSARAVILAGGTMSPFQDYETHLFPSHPQHKITKLSCGHVIPSSNLCVWTLASMRPATPAGNSDLFEFSFQKRRDKTMIQQLGTAILNICSAVPDGVVVFFPSYGYLDEVVAALQQKLAATGTAPNSSIWDKLQSRKAVFRETKGGSSDQVLEDYSNAILGEKDAEGKQRSPSQNGALLLSVVGGKMSEGINFSDRLGRCVVIVGLPYPNVASPEWKARMEYIDSSTVAGLLDKQNGTTAGDVSARESTPSATVTKPPSTITREQAAAAGKQAARDFYENACMRAVNQSIGRAIRHRGDYAAIVLLDRRFGTERIRAKLPGWIRCAMAPIGSNEKTGLPGLMGTLNKFFREKKASVEDQ
ncbi:DEAD_2 domain-containing protein [Pyricularia oryzae Y34]|uniref:ATP-dependent DNA helicase CHL1 n=1 Tax=Pyricularia oryzae (strain Y34) TaxID=1143189 RepID=A0AA97P1H0_PYRO3|nr:DEAD_2 domain-containing protein [Pyricularia oryzae Y34]